MKEIPVREFRHILRLFERALAAQNQSACCCGVTIPQCHVLMELDKQENITLNELSERVGLDKSTVSRTVETLVNGGMIERTIPRSNRRTTMISLTREGESTCKTINRGNDTYFRKVLSAISPEDREGFLRGFRALATSMERRNRAGESKV